MLASLREVVICSRGHVSASPPNTLPRWIAISAEIPLLPLTRLLRVCRVTPNASAVSVIVRPGGSVQSCRADGPGGAGFSWHGHSCCFLVVIDQINIGRVALLKAKDDAPIGTHGNTSVVSEVAPSRVKTGN
jgi:hypothetical protein